MKDPKPDRRGLRFFVLSCLLLAGCLSTQDATPRPPEIVYGQDLCEACGMIISDAKFAAATITLDNQPHKFDDIGDMVVYHMEHPEEQVRAWFVHDYETETWLRGEEAFYVLSSEIDSAMGHGIAAFTAKPNAETFANRLRTQVLTFDEMRLAIHQKVHG